MKKRIFAVMKFFFGVFLCAISIILAINANLGLGPWNALHVGIAMHLPLTLGMVSVSVGILFILIGSIFGQMPGLGTVGNMIFIGVFVDLINWSGIIPQSAGIVPGVLMLMASLVLMGVGSYYYLSVKAGAGPRDGLMVLLVKKTNKPVWLVRNMIESAALLLGIWLGAPIGIGTVIYVVGIGYAVQGAFKWFDFDAKMIVHRSIADDFKTLKKEIGYGVNR